MNGTYVASASAAAKRQDLPECLDGVDTSFLTGTTSHTPSLGPQLDATNVIEIHNSGDKKSDEEAYLEEHAKVESLVESVFLLSFEEAGMYKVVYNVETGTEESQGNAAAARRRIEFVMNHREKACSLTKGLMDMREARSKEAPTPRDVCALLDHFI